MTCTRKKNRQKIANCQRKTFSFTTFSCASNKRNFHLHLIVDGENKFVNIDVTKLHHRSYIKYSFPVDQIKKQQNIKKFNK